MPRTPTPGRRETNKALRDAMLFEAAVEIGVSEGLGAVSLHGVSKRAGLSKTTAITRFENPDALAAKIWRERYWPSILDYFETLMNTLDAARASGDAKPLAELLQRKWNGPENIFQTELLIQSRFREPLGLAVQETLGEYVRSQGAAGDADAARRHYLMALVIGRGIAHPFERELKIKPAEGYRHIAAALIEDAKPVKLPSFRATHIDVPHDLAPGDPALNTLLNTTLNLIGKYGFDWVTVRKIAKVAGYTEGLIFGRYKTKLEMFRDATRRQAEAGIAENEKFWNEVFANYSEGIASAIEIVEFSYVGRDQQRMVTLEQIRLTYHDEVMFKDFAKLLRGGYKNYAAGDFTGRYKESLSEYFALYALSFGVYVTAMLNPDAWRLPFDVVTVPLTEIRQQGLA